MTQLHRMWSVFVCVFVCVCVCVCSGGSRKLERGVHRGQLNRRDFTTPSNYNVRILTSIHALLLPDVESDYSLVHFVVR